LDAILSDGRLKSQHETGESLGYLDPNRRAKDEQDLFGYPLTLNPADRPIFGYIGPIDGKTDPVAVDQYGEVVVRLKNEIRARTTITTRDSLFHWDDVMPTPLEQPGIEAMDDEFIGVGVRARDLPTLSNPGNDQYVEAQIHGGVMVSDIAEVVFTIDPYAPAALQKEPEPQTTARLDELGIPWRVIHIPRPPFGTMYQMVGPVIEPRPIETPTLLVEDDFYMPTLGATAMDAPYVDRQRIATRRAAVIENHLAARQWGELRGITQPEYLRRLDAAVKKALDPSQVEIRVRVPITVLPGILADNRLKSQFETGTSEGTLNAADRAIAEKAQYGYPDDTPPEERPISGYVAPIGGDPDTVQYGGVVLRLKNDVRVRTTVLSGDTLAPGLNPEARAEHTPMPINEADNAVVAVLNYPTNYNPVPATEGEEGAYPVEEWDDATEGYVKVWRKNDPQPLTEEQYDAYMVGLREGEHDAPGAYDHLRALEQGVAHDRYQYWEAVVHGQVTVNDIAEVVFTPDDYRDTTTANAAKDALDRLGIPYRDVLAEPGERGYVEGLTADNWMTDKSQRRVDRVERARLDLVRPPEAEIEPMGMGEAGPLVTENVIRSEMEEAPPLVEGLPRARPTPRLAAPPPTTPARAPLPRPIGKDEVAAFAAVEDRAHLYADPNDTWRISDLTLNYGAPPTNDIGPIREHVVFTGRTDDGKAVFAHYSFEGILSSVATATFDENGQVTMVRVRYAKTGFEYATPRKPEDALFTSTPYQDAMRLQAAIDAKYGVREALPAGLFAAPTLDSPRRRIWEEAVVIRAEIAKALGKKPEDSRWRGSFVDTANNARGFIDWDGNIALKSNWAEMSIRDRQSYLIHELLHSFSDASPAVYRALPGWEEGPVEAMTSVLMPAIMEAQDYAPTENRAEGYLEYTQPLEHIGTLIGREDTGQFIRDLYAQPHAERQTWLVAQFVASKREGWNVLFADIRRMNIENPMDWGGATSRSRLTDRELDVATLTELANSIFQQGRDHHLSWAADGRTFYEPLARATTSIGIGQILMSRLLELDHLAAFDESEREMRNDLFRRLSGAEAGIVVSRRGERGVMMEPSQIPDIIRWHDEGDRNQATLAVIADNVGLPALAARGVMSGMSGGLIVAARYETNGDIRAFASYDGDAVAYYVDSEMGGTTSDLTSLRDALIAEEARQAAVVAAPVVPPISEWGHDGPADGITPDAMDAAYNNDTVLTPEDRAATGHIVTHTTPEGVIRVFYRDGSGTPVIGASWRPSVVGHEMIYGFRQGINPDYITAHLIDVRDAIIFALRPPDLVLSTRGAVVDMGLTPAEQDESFDEDIELGRDPGLMDQKTPEPDDWILQSDESTIAAAERYVTRRGLSPRRPFAWRSPYIIDGGVFYTDGSLKARVNVTWTGDKPEVSYENVEGNDATEDDLHIARNALVSLLERQPEFGITRGAIPPTPVTPLVEVPNIDEWTDTTPPMGTSSGLFMEAVRAYFAPPEFTAGEIRVIRDTDGIHAVLADFNGDPVYIAQYASGHVDWARREGADRAGVNAALGRMRNEIADYVARGQPVVTGVTRDLTRAQADALLAEMLVASGDRPTPDTTRLVRAMVEGLNNNAFPIRFTTHLPEGAIPIPDVPRLPTSPRWPNAGSVYEGALHGWAVGQGVAIDTPITDPDEWQTRFAEVVTTGAREWVGALHDSLGVAVWIRVTKMPEGWVGADGETTRIEATTRTDVPDDLRRAMLTEMLVKLGAFLAGAPVETSTPVYTRLSRDEAFTYVGEAYMGPQRPMVNALSGDIVGQSFVHAPTIENGIERVDGDDNIAYAYVEQGQVKVVLLAAQGVGGFIGWTGDAINDQSVAPYVLNYDRTMPRPDLMRVVGELRKAFFADGHIPQPGDPRRIVTPPGTEPVGLSSQPSSVSGENFVLNRRALGLADVGTPNTFESGVDAQRRPWVSLRDAEGVVAAVGYVEQVNGTPTRATVEVIEGLSRETRYALARKIDREIERRGLMWRFRDDEKGRERRARAEAESTAANASIEGFSPPQWAETVGWPTVPTVVMDRTAAFTTTDGVHGQFIRQPRWGGVETLVFDGEPSMDARVEALLGSRRALTEWDTLRGSLPDLYRGFDLSQVDTAESLDPDGHPWVAQDTAGFTHGVTDVGLRWYTMRENGQAVTVEVRPAVYGPLWVFTPGMDTDDAFRTLHNLLREIALYEEAEYPDWRNRLVAGPVGLSADAIHPIENTGILPFARDLRTVRAADIDEIGVILAAVPREVAANAQVHSETFAWISTNLIRSNEHLLAEGEIGEYKFAIVRVPIAGEADNRTQWIVRITDADGNVKAGLTITTYAGRARDESWTAYLPEQGSDGVTALLRAQLYAHLNTLLSRRPPYMTSMERSFSQVTFTEHNPKSRAEKALLKRAQEAMGLRVGDEASFWLDFDPATRSGTMVLVSNNVILALLKVARAEYDAIGSLIRVPGERGMPDDSVITAVLQNSQGVRNSAPVLYAVPTLNRLPLPQPPARISDNPNDRVARASTRFPVTYEPGSTLHVQADQWHIWQTYDAKGHRDLTFRVQVDAQGLLTGQNVEAYRSAARPALNPAEAEAIWRASYVNSPIGVERPEQIINREWRDPRLTDEDERIDSVEFLDMIEVPGAIEFVDLADGIHEAPVRDANVHLLFEIDHGALVQALIIPAGAIPGVLGVRVAPVSSRGKEWGTIPGGADVKALRDAAVEKGYITADTRDTLADYANPDIVANRILYTQTTTDDALLWDEVVRGLLDQEWNDYYGSAVADQIPDVFKAQGLDMDFNSTAISIAENVGYDVLSGPPDTHDFVTWDNDEGAVLYYSKTGALAGLIHVAMTPQDTVAYVHYNRVHAQQQRQGFAIRNYHWAVTRGTDIEKESGRHGLTDDGGKFFRDRRDQPFGRITMNVSRMRPEFGQLTTFDEVTEARDIPKIKDAHSKIVSELDGLHVETIPDSAPESYNFGHEAKMRPVFKTTPMLGIFEGGGEPSMRIEIDPADATPDDMDLAAAYEVRKQEQDAVVVTVIAPWVMHRFTGVKDNANGVLLRIDGISTSDIRALYGAVGELTPNASIDDKRGVVEYSMFGDETTLDPEVKDKWVDLARRFNGHLTLTPAHIRWYWHDEAARAAATWMPTGPNVVSLTADEVIASLKGKNDDRADQIPGPRPAPESTDAGADQGGSVGVRPTRRRRPRTVPGAVEADGGEPGTARPEAGPSVPPRPPRPSRRRAYDAPADGRLTAAVPHAPDLAAVRVEAETVLRSIVDRYGGRNLHWSGEVRIATTVQPPNSWAFLDWDGALVLIPGKFETLNEEGQRMVIAHEMMHAISNSDQANFQNFPFYEEGLAEALARVWCEENGVRNAGAYKDALAGLTMQADLIGMPHEEFFRVLLATPVAERADKVLSLMLTHPTHPVAGFTDPHEALLFSIAFMQDTDDMEDAGAVIPLLRRVAAEGNIGPLAMEMFMERLARTPVYEWSREIGALGRSKGVNIYQWTDLSAGTYFPFTQHSVTAFSLRPEDEPDWWTKVEARTGAAMSSRRLPRPPWRSRRRQRRTQSGHILWGANEPPEVRHWYDPLPTPVGVV
jgi:hypothetical protein